MPDGPTSAGRCIKCGEVRLFKNSNPELRDYYGDMTKDTWALAERLQR